MVSKMILIAGPYRSGTNGDTTLIAKNLERLEAAALAVYRLGPHANDWRVGRASARDSSRFG